LYYKVIELKGRLHCKKWQTFLEKVCKIVDEELDAEAKEGLDGMEEALRWANILGRIKEKCESNPITKNIHGIRYELDSLAFYIREKVKEDRNKVGGGIENDKK